MSSVLLNTGQYSSDIWPLKIKQNCIVDKSLAVRTISDISLALRLSLYRSIQRKKLYSRMSNVLLNSSILAIYGLWKSSEIGQIVLLTNRSQHVLLTNHSQYVS
jgi:hypothetical protein